MSDTSFTKRRIEIAIKLANETKTNQPVKFSSSGTDTVSIANSRTSVRIQNAGAPAGSTASVDIFGLDESLMNQLSTLGMVFNMVPKNTITIQAGDEQSGMSTVFVGTIMSGYADYNQAPNVPFHIEANSILADAVAPAVVTSFKGSAAVADIMAGFAKLMGLTFENSGVDTKLANPYFSGNVRTQMRTCADHANINAEIINGSKLAIWPKGGNRTGGEIPEIGPSTGMILYPAYTQQGIMLRTLFDPKITFGGLVKVRSRVKAVNDVGQWAVNQLNLALDAQVPKGKWEAVIAAYNPKYPKPIPPQA
jgi:hypothetical protein